MLNENKSVSFKFAKCSFKHTLFHETHFLKHTLFFEGLWEEGKGGRGEVTPCSSGGKGNSISIVPLNFLLR